MDRSGEAAGRHEIKLPATLAMAAYLDDLPFAAGPSPLQNA